MSKKQFIWLVVAVALFAVTGYFGVKSAAQAEEQTRDLTAQVESLVSGTTEEQSFPDNPFLAKVSVEGTIASSGSATSLTGGDSFDLDAETDYIESLIDCENNVGILLTINSPGGEMSASDQLYYKLMDYKKLTGRPIYCFFGDLACSGGYYAAMPADEIWADRNSMCVNIGVYISTYNFAGLFEKYGVEQIAFKSSENKGIGMAGIPWTDEQKAIYQSIVDEYYEQFLEVVAEGRGMTTAQVRALDDGREMTAKQALAAGFIDGIGRYEEYEADVLSRCGADVTLYEPTYTPGLLDELMGYISSVSRKSDSQVWQEFADAHSGIVVMAYDAAY